MGLGDARLPASSFTAKQLRDAEAAAAPGARRCAAPQGGAALTVGAGGGIGRPQADSRVDVPPAPLYRAVSARARLPTQTTEPHPPPPLGSRGRWCCAPATAERVPAVRPFLTHARRILHASKIGRDHHERPIPAACGDARTPRRRSGCPQVAVRYARNLYATVERGLPDAAALVGWMSTHIVSLGLHDTEALGEEPPSRSRSGVSAGDLAQGRPAAQDRRGPRVRPRGRHRPGLAAGARGGARS